MVGLDGDEEHEYDFIRQKITDEAERQPFWGEELPKLWIPLQHHIDVLRHNGVKIITMKDIEGFNASTAVPMDAENIDLCLRFLHSLGQIIYFSLPGLNEHIILVPQFLVTALRSLITCKQFCEKNKIRKDAYAKLAKTGMITKDSIDQIWREKQFSLLHLHQEYLLKVMEKLDLIAAPKRYLNGSIECLDFYYIPCMVKEEGDAWIQKKKNIDDNEKVRRVYFDFSCQHLPPAVFYRLMGSCLSMWPLVGNHLHFGCCYIQIDPLHRMLLTALPDKIVLTFEPRKSMSLIVGNGVADILEEILENVLSLYSVEKDNRIFQTDRREITLAMTQVKPHFLSIDFYFLPLSIKIMITV